MSSRQALALLAGVLLMIAAGILAMASIDPGGADTSAGRGGNVDCGSLARPEDPESIPDGQCHDARTTRTTTVGLAAVLGLVLAGSGAANLDTRVREREGWPPPRASTTDRRS